MNFIIFLIVGLVAGLIAKAIMPGNKSEPSGWILTTVLGIAGAFVGGFIGNMLNIGGGSLVMSIVLAAVGAIVIIGLLRLFTGNRSAV